jgi:hypothetical protein
MPTSTDLVTDLPADFATFGQAVATSMADLLGGTSGQILAKASNTDMDFTWITNDVGDITAVNVTAPITGGGTSGAVTIGVDAGTTAAAGVVQLTDSTSSTSITTAATPNAVKSAYDLANNAIAKSTVTTAGDIIYRNSTVPTRLGIGTAGQILRVNSGATAPEWATASAGGMTFISRTTFSNVASQTIDSIFSSSYYNYLVVIEKIYASTETDDLQFQMRYGTTTDTGTNYNGNAVTTVRNSPNVAVTQNFNTSAFTFGVVAGNSSYVSTYAINFNQVGNGGDRPTFHGTGNSGANEYGAVWFGGDCHNGQNNTGILLKSSSSNISGAVSVYGLAKA